MSAASTLFFPGRQRVLSGVFWGGLFVGILDLTVALVGAGLQGYKPVGVFKAIASGLLGMSAFKGNGGTVFLGLVLHFFVAFMAAAVFELASRRLRVLTQRAVLSGLVYGLVVYAVMNGVVLPLSAYPKALYTRQLSVGAIVVGLIEHALVVGLPISLCVRHYSVDSVVRNGRATG